jgi:hypothetical protein
MHRKRGRWFVASGSFFRKSLYIKHLRCCQVGATGFEAADKIAVTADCECPCDFCHGWRAANALQRDDSKCLDLASLDADFQRVVSAWGGLPQAIRRAILALTEP